MWNQNKSNKLNTVVGSDDDFILARTTDYKSDVAAGFYENRKVWNKFGYNSDVDTGGEEILASWGGSFDPMTDIITTAQTFTISYTNTSDGEGTTGALSLFITYLDENNLDATAVHTLGNTGSDVTSFTGLGINRIVVLSNGGDGYNSADITITATTDTTTQAQIPAESSVTQQCILHTQVGYNFLADWILLNAIKDSGGGGNPRVTFKVYSWSRATSTRYEVFRHTIDTADNTSININPSQKFVIGGREVFYITVSTTSNNVFAKGRFSGIEEVVL